MSATAHPAYRLYTYFRSSAAYRVRIALHLKGLAFDAIPVHLLLDGGQQRQPSYTRLNPQQLVPLLTLGEQSESNSSVAEVALSQSLAIMEYLDECHPQPALLPATALGRARVRSLALAVACDIHPLNNLRVLQHLEHTLHTPADQRQAWMHHWMHQGFAPLEQRLSTEPDTGLCCHGDTPTLADCCLIPQVYNAQRFAVDLSAYPTLQRIAQHCQGLPAFQAASPERQPDAPVVV